MIRHVENSKGRRYIIGTEEGMIYRLETLFPGNCSVPPGR